MREMMSYIFTSLEHTQYALRNQTRFNKAILLTAIGLTAAVYFQQKEIKALRMKVNTLTEPVNTVEE